MAPRLDELAKTIDLTLPSARASAATVEKLCATALELHVVSVCVPPKHVAAAAGFLRGEDVKVSAVVGLPNGSSPLADRIAAARSSIEEGADELELVLNVPLMLAGDFRLARDELQAVARAARTRSANMRGAWPLLKMVAEISQLGEKRSQLACKIAEELGADFVQTSSGFGPDGTTPYDVELLREWLPDSIAVKASGRIKSAKDVYAMLTAGAGRVGTSAAKPLAGA